MTDKEWQDGDDSALYDEGFDAGAEWGAQMARMYVDELHKRMKRQYRRGVKDAYEYVIEELGLDISDSDLLDRLGVS